MKISIIYHSETGNTEKMAELVREGCQSVEGVEARCMPVEGVDEGYLQDSAAVLLGSPTYEGTCSWQMKKFLDEAPRGLHGKLAGVFASQNWPGGGGADFAELTMIAALAEGSSIRLVFASVLPIHDYNKDQNPRYLRSPQRPPKTILDLNAWLERFCQQNGHGYLDYFSQMVDADGFLQRELADDGLHPNANGYRAMAPLAQQAIDKVIRGKQRKKKRKIRFPF